MYYRTLAAIKEDHPLFFSRDTMAFFNTDRVYKRGDYVISRDHFEASDGTRTRHYNVYLARPDKPMKQIRRCDTMEEAEATVREHRNEAYTPEYVLIEGVNRDRDTFHPGEPEELWTDDIGRLYRSLQREYGRCSGHVNVDTKDGETHVVGWVFVKRANYADSDDTFLLETWITLLNSDKKYCYFKERS